MRKFLQGIIIITILFLSGCNPSPGNQQVVVDDDSLAKIKRIEPRTRDIILPDVDLTQTIQNNDSIYIACRVPINASAVLFVRDDSLHQSIVGAQAVSITTGMSQPRNADFFDTSQWILWKINSLDYIKQWHKTPRKATFELRVNSDSGNIWGGEFGIFRGRDVKKLIRSTAIPAPASLKAGSMQFNYRVDADADIRVEILPLDIEEAKPFFTDRKTDIPAGLRIYGWNFVKNNGSKILPGDYYIRFRCSARNSLEQVNDVCIPFKVID